MADDLSAKPAPLPNVQDAKPAKKEEDKQEAPKQAPKKADKSDDEKGVELTNPKGRKVFVPASQVEDLKAKGFK